jgi:gluconolactonase
MPAVMRARWSGVGCGVLIVCVAACGAPAPVEDAAVDAASLADRPADTSADSGASPDAAAQDATSSLPDVAAQDAMSPQPDASAPDASAPDASAPVNPLDGIGAVEMVRGGFMFTEGPQWRSREGDLLFTDIPANTIHRLMLPMAVMAFRQPSDNANGLAVDAMGRLLAAEHGSRSVTRTLANGMRETLASGFMEGGAMRRLNSPNDLIVRSDGTVYFTDPPYGINPATQQELSFNGVFRRTAAGALSAEWRGARASRPNGIALSPDERTLYFTDTSDGRVRAMDVGPDGALSGERTLATTSGNPDGMAVDRDGNLFVTTNSGVQVFSPAGRLWGTIAVPMQPANCAFGAADGRTLFVTARNALYRVRLARPGLY